ncbi:MAG: SAM-dependent methyltransferase, partial [Actinomycetota bacterium]
VACEAVRSSRFFDRKFDGAVAWGLLFLLPSEAQSVLIHKVSDRLVAGGRFLFTAPRQACEWQDVLTDRTSVSMGREGYRAALQEAGLVLVDEREDEGENHYFLAARPG